MYFKHACLEFFVTAQTGKHCIELINSNLILTFHCIIISARFRRKFYTGVGKSRFTFVSV